MALLLYDWLTSATREHGGDKALVYRDTYLSWRGLTHRVDRRAMELGTMGLSAGDWIGVMLGNIPEFVILSLAIAKVGGVVVPLDPTLGSRELDLVLGVAPLRGLITRPRGGESAAAGATEERKPRRKPAPQARRRLQGTLLTCSIYAPSGSAPSQERDPQAVLFTADSAGDVKGVVRARSELLAATEQIAGTLDATAKDRVLAAVPLYHAYGFDSGFALPLRHGATMFLEDELSEKRILKILREHEANFVPGTPAVYQSLLRQPTARRLRTKGARFLSAGARLEAATHDAFLRRYGVRLLSCYHTTEAGPVSVDVRGQDPETVGKPFAGVDLRIGDGDGATSGPIWVRSGAAARRTVGSRPAGGEGGGAPVGGFDAKGWFRTGDMGRMDRGGRLVLLGREDDVVKVDGRRVALGEVEACIEAIGRVVAAKAAVEADPLGGSFVVARVVPRGRIAAEEIIDHCAKNLAPYKVPRRVEFCQELS